MPRAAPRRRETRFVDDPPDGELVAVLGVLRRPRRDHESPPFEEPDWLPFLASVSVLHCRRLAGPPGSTTDLVVGRESSGGQSVAAVFVASDDVLALAFGPASADEIARGSAVSSASGGPLQLVPDGVAAAELHFADGGSAVATVDENLWWHRRAEDRDPFPQRLRWLDAEGNVLRAFED